MLLYNIYYYKKKNKIINRKNICIYVKICIWGEDDEKFIHGEGMMKEKHRISYLKKGIDYQMAIFKIKAQKNANT